MKKSMFNFQLKHPDSIHWGNSMHWFALTDGEYWIDMGDVKLYEYNKALLTEIDAEKHTYLDYYIVRFIEDFTNLFENISESIPDRFYEIVKKHSTLDDYRSEIFSWFDKATDQSTDDEAFYDEYELMKRWIYSRNLTALHMKGGPVIGFYRNGGKISVVWDTDAKTENSTRFWTAESGQMEMDYSAFIMQVEDFGLRFFSAMDKQVDIALYKDWGDIEIDKYRLFDEHKERKMEFEKKLDKLKNPSKQITNWDLVRAVTNKNLSI